jgi:hypothetical protein
MKREPILRTEFFPYPIISKLSGKPVIFSSLNVIIYPKSESILKSELAIGIKIEYNNKTFAGG